MQLPRSFSPPGPHAPAPEPTYAAALVQLAFFATGDVEAGHALAARALATTSTSRDAVRAIARRLPRKTRAWPTRQVIERVESEAKNTIGRLAALARWTPRERLALALYLVGGVPRRDIGEWVDSVGLEERLVGLVATAAGIAPLTAPDENDACHVFAGSMLDVDDPDLGRNLRLHMLGCTRCVERVVATRAVLRAMRDMVERFFPPEPPRHVPRAGIPPRRKRQAARLARLALACLLVFAVTVGIAWSAESRAGTARSERATVTAAALVDRALNRFSGEQRSGVLHERLHMGEGTDALVIERYTDYQPPHRMWLTLQKPGDDTLLLDLRTDGGTRLWYRGQNPGGTPTTVSIDDPRINEMQPLLRNLPAVGPLGSFPSARARTDVTLLAAATTANPTLLGTTTFAGRPAYLLSYVDEQEAERIVLTIDAETATLLRATAATAAGNGSSTQLWQAEIVEIVTPESAPSFDLPPAVASDEVPNPRHLLLQPFSNIRLGTLLGQHAVIPMPLELPPDTSLAYLRNGNLYGIVQVYEGAMTTVAIVSNYYHMFTPPPEPLTERAGSTRWRVAREDTARSVTQIEFAPARGAASRALLYVWHAQLGDRERLELATRVLEMLRWPTVKEAATLEERFVLDGGRAPRPQGETRAATTAGR